MEYVQENFVFARTRLREPPKTSLAGKEPQKETTENELNDENRARRKIVSEDAENADGTVVQERLPDALPG